MGIIKPTNKSVESFKGLHLYHAGFSNCSMRVRIALEEKKLAWTNHLVDLSDPYLSVAQGTPVIWFEFPTSNSTGVCFSGSECGC